MDVVSEVGDKIYMIAHYPEKSIYAFQAFFIDGDRPALIEPGPASFIPKVVEGLGRLGYDVGCLSYIIPTHIHADHCGGTGHLAQYAPRARIIAHEKGARHLVNPAKMMEATSEYWGEDYESEIGVSIPVSWERIDVVRGGESIALGNRTLSIIHTPGHARHHICLHDGRSGELFCGESLGYLLEGEEVTLLPIVSPPVFDLDSQMSTIDRLRRLRPSTLFFSHLGVRHDASRCIEIAEESDRAWGDLVLRALENGEGREQIKARLTAIVERLQPGRSGLFSRLVDWAVVGYTGYFIQKGVVASKAQERG